MTKLTFSQVKLADLKQVVNLLEGKIGNYQMRIEYSREYVKKNEPEIILKILKGIVSQNAFENFI